MRNKGFTLLEVLLAIAILASGMLLLGSTWTGNLMRLRKANLYSDVGVLLERKMVEIDAEYRDKPLSEIPETDDGDFGSEYARYSWRMESRDLKFPDLSSIIIGKEGGADENLLSMLRQMTDILGKAIKEVKVTIVVKGPKKDMEFSATNYIIDYKAGISGVSGAPGAAPAGGG